MAKTTQHDIIVNDFIDFLNASPTAFHAVEEAKKRLENAGYFRLCEREDWKLVHGGKYFFTRNHSTIVAFAVGHKYVPGNGFCVVAAHTDSPCLKLKPVSKVTKGGFLEIGVQTYGGGIWHTWFDRDLSVAGRVMVKKTCGDAVTYKHELVRVKEPIIHIPSLAIHLNRGVNDGFKVNTQTDLVPVIATTVKANVNKLVGNCESSIPKANEIGDHVVDLKQGGTEPTVDDSPSDNSHHLVLLKLVADRIGCKSQEICDFELQLYDTQPSSVGGAGSEFIFSGCLDNLCMSYCSLQGLIDSTTNEEVFQDETVVRMITLFDHEEVGSASAQGAGSPVLLNAITRVTSSLTAPNAKIPLEKTMQKSFLVSADMAHCLHPNYMDRHEENHQPKLHKGLVIKNNANQRYATNAVTSLVFREIGKNHNLPTQDFVVRNDMACGSTVGPILASGTGIRTVDVGAPQLAMHSIREMCGVDDVVYSYQHFKAFFDDYAKVDESIVIDG